MQVGTGPNEKQQAPTAPQQAYPPYGAAQQPTVFVVQQPPPMMYQPPPPAQDASLCLIIAAIGALFRF